MGSDFTEFHPRLPNELDGGFGSPVWLISSQPCDLPHVVAGVDPVELAPLLRAQRAEDEVIC